MGSKASALNHPSAELAQMPEYPEYYYPFSVSGELEDQIEAMSEQNGNVPVTKLLQLLYPQVNEGKDGEVCFNPKHFRKYYPHKSHFDSKLYWACEIATASNGYPHNGVKVGDLVQLSYGQPLLRGGKPTFDTPEPYHCPYGWRRFSLQVDNYEETCGTWALAYHGTKVESLFSIIENCIQPGVCQEGGNGSDVYLTPSIEYASCPRYATPFRWTGTTEADARYVQVAIQYRCKRPRKVQAETLGVQFVDACPGGWASQPWGDQEGGNGKPYPQRHKVFDPHYKNDELEWLFSLCDQALKEQLVPTGIMVRVLKEDPVVVLRRRWESTPMEDHP